VFIYCVVLFYVFNVLFVFVLLCSCAIVFMFLFIWFVFFCLCLCCCVYVYVSLLCFDCVCVMFPSTALLVRALDISSSPMKGCTAPDLALSPIVSRCLPLSPVVSRCLPNKKISRNTRHTKTQKWTYKNPIQKYVKQKEIRK